MRSAKRNRKVNSNRNEIVTFEEPEQYQSGTPVTVSYGLSKVFGDVSRMVTLWCKYSASSSIYFSSLQCKKYLKMKNHIK